ncbi:MAG: NAD(P)/FAD-dependent oxidoreductase, partial [Tissierellia bacterium]|nr:NAD(P)/FAD-dependent oxidoreductase [Tissierellia bacterium]
MYDLIIIGGGIAGMSAAICASGRDMNFIVIERDKLGGKVGRVSTLVNFAGVGFNESGREFIKRVEEQLQEENVQVVYEEVQEVSLMSNPKIIRTDKNTYEAKTVILANGTNPNTGRFKGEKELMGKGVYFDPQEYGKTCEGKPVIVLGGSEYAIKEALHLA